MLANFRAAEKGGSSVACSIFDSFLSAVAVVVIDIFEPFEFFYLFVIVEC